MYQGERFNSITHLVGAVLALVGLIVLVVQAALHGGALRIVSASVYGASLLILYTSSTLYHSVRGAAKRVFRQLDHVAIYLLIAGTYTPFTLVVLGGRLGWWLFGAVWALALVGILQEFRKAKGQRILSLVIYLGMGWVGVLAFRPLAGALGTAGLVGPAWRRPLLHGGRGLLRARPQNPGVPRRLAPLRAGREPGPLPRDPQPDRLTCRPRE